MHPEIVRDEPGDCPICGMALEPMTVTLEEEDNPELVAMTRRFWVSAALTVPLGHGRDGHGSDDGARSRGEDERGADR